MSQRILRPLSYGDLLDEVFDLYKSNFLLLVGIAGVAYIPIQLIAYAIGGQYTTAIAAILMAPLNYVILAATTWCVSQRYLGQGATIAGSYRAIAHRLVPFILTMVLVFLATMAGLIACIVGSIICAFWFAFVSEVFVLEGKTYVTAMKRSRQLAEGQWGRILVVGLLAGLLVWIGSMAITYPVMFLLGMFGRPDATLVGGAPGAIMGLASGISQALLTPIQVMAFVLLYYDIRVRKEGFDIQMLAANLSGTPIPQAPQMGPAPYQPVIPPAYTPPAPEPQAPPSAPPPAPEPPAPPSDTQSENEPPAPSSDTDPTT